MSNLNKVKVNITNDISVGVLSHFQVPPFIPVPSVEVPTPQKWWPGYWLNQNKLTTTVKHKKKVIVQDGHDCGAMIPDLTLPIVNAWYAVMWPASKRKIIFSASTVKMNKKAVGLAQGIHLPPIPMLTCGDPVSAPTALVVNNVLNTVRVGVTPKDLVAGLGTLVGSMILDMVAFRKWPPEMGKTLARTLLDETRKKVFWFTDKGEAMKTVLGALSDFGTGLLKGDVGIKLPFTGTPFVGGEVEWNKNPDPGQKSVTVRGNVLGHQVANQGDKGRWGQTVN